ncbi:MAG: SsrA-binding protein [Elusimicrobia bacterium]|nr:MAG: SsrA-binding protein [Elusimicrobiota bacterium]
MAKPAKTTKDEGRIQIGENRKARHHYEILDVVEAGLQLKGPEVKSLRARQLSFEGAFARIDGGEAFLHNLHIAPYSHNSLEPLPPTRTRKLLLRKKELKKLTAAQEQKGMTLIPLEVYFLRGWAKVALGLGKGKKGPDKRDDLRRKDAARELARSFKGRFKA